MAVMQTQQWGIDFAAIRALINSEAEHVRTLINEGNLVAALDAFVEMIPSQQAAILAVSNQNENIELITEAVAKQLSLDAFTDLIEALMMMNARRTARQLMLLRTPGDRLQTIATLMKESDCGRLNDLIETVGMPILPVNFGREGVA